MTYIKLTIVLVLEVTAYVALTLADGFDAFSELLMGISDSIYND